MFDCLLLMYMRSLCPPTNKIDHNSIEAMLIHQVSLKHWEDMQYLALKHWCYCIEQEATYASFPAEYISLIHSSVYWEIHSDINSHVLSAVLMHLCNFLLSLTTSTLSMHHLGWHSSQYTHALLASILAICYTP